MHGKEKGRRMGWGGGGGGGSPAAASAFSWREEDKTTV